MPSVTALIDSPSSFMLRLKKPRRLQIQNGLGDGVPEPRVCHQKRNSRRWVCEGRVDKLLTSRKRYFCGHSFVVFFGYSTAIPGWRRPFMKKFAEFFTNQTGLPPEDKPESWEVNGILSFEQLKDMHYLQAALTECVRIYAPVPPNVKVAMADDV